MFTLVWLSIIGVTIGVTVVKGGWHQLVDSARMYTNIRWKHFWLGLVSLGGTALLALGLSQIPLTILKLGWWNLIEVNTSSNSDSTAPVTVHAASTLTFLILIGIIIILFALSIPMFARSEEEGFRADLIGAERSEILKGGLVFGLAHLVMGIPVWAALALSFTGIFLTWVLQRSYDKTDGTHEEKLEAGIVEATAVHTIHNAILCGLIGFIVLTYIVQLV